MQKNQQKDSQAPSKNINSASSNPAGSSEIDPDNGSSYSDESSSSDSLFFTSTEIEEMSNKQKGLSYIQKLQLFDYIKEGVQVLEMQKDKIQRLSEKGDGICF